MQSETDDPCGNKQWEKQSGKHGRPPCAHARLSASLRFLPLDSFGPGEPQALASVQAGTPGARTFALQGRLAGTMACLPVCQHRISTPLCKNVPRGPHAENVVVIDAA